MVGGREKVRRLEVARKTKWIAITLAKILYLWIQKYLEPELKKRCQWRVRITPRPLMTAATRTTMTTMTTMIAASTTAAIKPEGQKALPPSERQ